jgi:hypothetical protein
MISTELIQYYESFVGRQRQRPTEENPHLPGIYSRDQGRMGSEGHPCATCGTGPVLQPAAGRSIVWKLQLRYV